MNASFGIDHPLIATHNIESLRARLISIGFNMTAIGEHPWGTSTTLAMFEGCLIEIMGIYDETLLDNVPAGNFRFGRHVYQNLQQREGVALTALHSSDSRTDAAKAAAAGFTVAGHLEFGRDVSLPDGRTDRTQTTLALLPDQRWPRLSFFLCQQHRPDLIYVPQWLQHPNSVHGIAGITIVAQKSDHKPLQEKLVGLYARCETIKDGFQVLTANGPMRIQSKSAIESDFGKLPEELKDDNEPGIVALDLKYENEGTLRSFLSDSGLSFHVVKSVYVLDEPTLMGNMFLRFVKR